MKCDEHGHRFYLADSNTEMYCDWEAEVKPWVHNYVTVKCENCDYEARGDWTWLPPEASE